MTGCQHILPLLPEYLNRTLGKDDQSNVQEHLDTCPHCTGELQKLSRLFTALSNSKTIELPASYLTTILPRLHERIEHALRPPIAGWIEQFASPVGAAFVLVMIAMHIIPAGNGSTSDNFRSVLSTVETDQLETVRSEHEIAALIELQPYRNDESDTEASLRLILDEESEDAVYAYMGSDQILNDFNDDDISALLSIMNTKPLSQ